MRGVVKIILVCVVLKQHVVNGQDGTSIRQPCQYDLDCPENAYCSLQTECRCKDDYFPQGVPNTGRESCLKRVQSIGEACSADVQCQLTFGTSSLCNPVLGCQCRQGAHFLHDRCYNTSKIGESCLTRDNCFINQTGIPLSCDRSICVCPQNFHSNRDGTQCIHSVALGRPCNSTEQCTATNSICFEECRCDVHHIANSNNTHCLPEAERIGDTCQESPQCSRGISDSACVRGLCQCLDSFHPGRLGRMCWRTTRLGSPCTDDNQCVPTFPWDPRVNLALAACVDNCCRCASGFIEDGFRCVESMAGMLKATNIIFILTAFILGTSSVQQFC